MELREQEQLNLRRVHDAMPKGIEVLYGTLRSALFGWSWEEIAESTDEQIIITIAAHERQNKSNKDTPPDGTSCVMVDKELAERATEEQLKEGFFRTASRFANLKKDPKAKAALEAQWEEWVVEYRNHKKNEQKKTK